MYPWQMEMLEKMIQYKGRGLTQITGRNTGKGAFSGAAFQRLWDEIHNRPVEELKLTEGTIYGSRYHCVEPVGGNWREMETWCYQMFGNAGDTLWGEPKAPEPAQRWYMNNRKFWFRNEQDRMIFVLKWR